MMKDSKQNFGLASHCYHDIKYEWCFDLTDRIRVIEETKLPEEQRVRKRHFWLFDSTELPPDLLAVGMKLHKMLDRLTALNAKHQSRLNALNTKYMIKRAALCGIISQSKLNAFDNTFSDRLKVLRDAYDAKCEPLYDDWEEKVGAVQALIRKYTPELDAIHAVRCKRCRWNGRTIFTKHNKKGTWI